MRDDDRTEMAARRRRKTPQQRKAEEYAHERVSAAEHPHLARVARPRRRARGHRNERRAVAQVLVKAASEDADDLTTKARVRPPQPALWKASKPLTERLGATRARRTLQELSNALADGSGRAGDAQARRILDALLQSTRHGVQLALCLDEMIADSARKGGMRWTADGTAAERLRELLRDDPARLRRMREWICACGIVPRDLAPPADPADPAAQGVRVPSRHAPRRWINAWAAPTWPELRDGFRAWFLAAAPAGLSAHAARAADVLRAEPPWRAEVGGRIETLEDSYWVRLEARGRVVVVPVALARGLDRRVREDLQVLLGRRLSSREGAWAARFGTVGAAEAALRELKRVEEPHRDAWLAERIAEWKGEVRQPRRRRALSRRPRRQ